MAKKTKIADKKKKTMRQKDIEAKEEIIYESVFIYLKRNRS